MSSDGDKEPVRIARVDRYRGNLLAIAQAKMRPGRARVGGFVDSVADGQIGAMQPFAAADVNDFRVGGRNRDGADGAGRLRSKMGFQVRP